MRFIRMKRIYFLAAVFGVLRGALANDGAIFDQISLFEPLRPQPSVGVDLRSGQRVTLALREGAEPSRDSADIEAIEGRARRGLDDTAAITADPKPAFKAQSIPALTAPTTTASHLTKAASTQTAAVNAVPGRFIEKAKGLKFTSTGATATLPQFALADYMANGGYDHHLRGLRHALKRQMEQIGHAVAESFPREIKMTRPTGGIVLWVELPPRVDSLRLQAKAFAEKISIAPGPMFSPRNQFRNFIRLSCGEPWSAKIERAIGLLAYLVKQQMGAGR